MSALCEQIEREAGKIDVLVNNAGIVKDSLFASMSYEDFTQVIETNMFSIFRLTKDALMLLRAAENPAIINVASIAALIPQRRPGELQRVKRGDPRLHPHAGSRNGTLGRARQRGRTGND